VDLKCKTLEFLESILIFSIIFYCYNPLSELVLRLIYDCISHDWL